MESQWHDPLLVVHGALRLLRVAVLMAVLSCTCALAVEAPGDGPVFAKVGETVITVAQYRTALQEAARWRFYHGRPSAGEIAAFQREVAEDLIDRVLLLAEAGRRGLVVDQKAVDRALERRRERARRGGVGAPQPLHVGEPGRQREAQSQLIGRLREEVESRVRPPTESDLQAYYRRHREKFTEPARQRVSLILLKVDPSSPASTWDAARREARALVERLRRGAEFAELARLHSADASAEAGGDMGYLHEGRLGGEPQAVVSRLAIGEVSDPVTVLEGVAIFRVTDRQASHLAAFSQVRERARGLCLQDKREAAWTAFRASLRADTRVELDEAYLTPAGRADSTAAASNSSAAPLASKRPWTDRER